MAKFGQSNYAAQFGLLPRPPVVAPAAQNGRTPRLVRRQLASRPPEELLAPQGRLPDDVPGHFLYPDDLVGWRNRAQTTTALDDYAEFPATLETSRLSQMWRGHFIGDLL